VEIRTDGKDKLPDDRRQRLRASGPPGPLPAAARTQGNVFYVSSTATSKSDSTGYGRSPDAPFATLDYAIGQATATNGDVIVVLPGHVETVTAASGVALDVAGLTILGIGNGHSRPKINFTTNVAASFDISAANCRVENLWFNCAIDDQTSLVNVSAADVTLRGCEFMLGDSSFDAEAGVTITGAGDRFVIEDCQLDSTSSTAITNGAITFGACDDSVIRRCVIQGFFGTAGNIVNSAAAVNVTIADNVLVNRSADANNKTIVLHSSSVGLIARNSMAVIDSTSPAPVTAAAAFVAGNYFTGAVGVSASTLM
jgi:hypothetical protein